MDNEPGEFIALAWYRPEEWPRLLQVSEDREDLEKSFEEWEQFALKTFRELQKAGVSIRKVEVRIDDLVLWCARNRVPVDSQARADFACQKLRDQSAGIR